MVRLMPNWIGAARIKKHADEFWQMVSDFRRDLPLARRACG
jgi:hypothetical protein